MQEVSIFCIVSTCQTVKMMCPTRWFRLLQIELEGSFDLHLKSECCSLEIARLLWPARYSWNKINYEVII